MSKIVCDICGTSYDDAAGSCPVCGWNPNSDLPADGADIDPELLDDIQVDLPAFTTPAGAPKGPVAPAGPRKAAFDYDEANKKRRRQNKNAAPEEDEDDEEEESGSNTFLVIILVLLILALLAVSAYIGWTKILKPKMGNEDNKPKETITAQVEGDNIPTVDAVELPTEEATEETEPGIPCTSLAPVGTMDKLTFKGQYWRLMVKAEPENTTEKIVYTSGDETVVTIDEYGRVTAVGEGETTIVVTCGDQRVEIPAAVSFKTETAETEAPAEGASESGSTESTTPTAGSTTTATGVLKLKKSDITIGRRGVYVTLELEGGIAAEDVDWTTSDSGVATVFNGNVTALNKGTCIITAEYNGQTAQCIVRCKF